MLGPLPNMDGSGKAGELGMRARKRSPFGAPDYIPTTDSPHDTPVLERLEKCIGRRVTPYQFGSGTFF